MFGPEYFNVVAYRVQGDCPHCGSVGGDPDTFFGEYLCRTCGESDGRPTSASVSAAEMDDINDEGHGVYCERCSSQIASAYCTECGAEASDTVILEEDGRSGRMICAFNTDDDDDDDDDDDSKT